MLGYRRWVDRDCGRHRFVVLGFCLGVFVAGRDMGGLLTEHDCS